MKIGEMVENFQLNDQFNNKFDLYENLDEDVLLVFYPKDNSLVCTRQLVDYNSNLDELKKIGIKIVGINIDPVQSHNSFCTNNRIDFPVLSDPDKKVSKFFEALNPIGQNKRKLVLVGKDKLVKYQRSVLSVFFLDSKELLKDLREKQLL
ncbi:MAG TPA: peroxiredoxin family protein [Ignavibacteriaceae bacterium]